jgi:hypothetical protein
MFLTKPKTKSSQQQKSVKKQKISTKKSKSSQTLKNRRVKRPDGKEDVFTPLEREFQHFIGMVSIRIDGQDIGGLLCKKGESSYRLQFGFTCQGIPASLTEIDADAIWDKIDGGFKELPANEVLTIRLKSTSNDLPQQLRLSKLREKLKNNNPVAAQLDTELLDAMLVSRKNRLRELTKQGDYQPKSLTLFGSHTTDSNEEYADGIEKVLAWGVKFFRKNITNEHNTMVYDHLCGVILDAYGRGYKNWEAILNDKCGLAVTPMTVEELWEYVWSRFNDTPPIKIPGYLVFDKDGLGEVSNDDLSLISALMETEASIPVATRSHVYHRGAYEAVMIMSGKPKGWTSVAAHLRYFWGAIADLPDVELITQVRLGNQATLENNLVRQTKQAVGRSNAAAAQNTVSARASVDLVDSIEAQQALYGGSVALKISPVAIIRRKSLKDLRNDCQTFRAKFFRPATWVREMDYCWIPWMQTFTGMRYDLLNTEPYNRQMNCLTGEIHGLVPLTTVASKDKSGVELISTEGKSPVYVNIFGDEARHMGIYGSQRSGKSVLAEAFILEALANGMPVSIIDYPRSDGSGTFSEFVPLLGGSYFSPTNQCLNIFELPKLKGMPKKEQGERLVDFQENLLEMIREMVQGDSETRTLLSTILEQFFADPTIKQRYFQANKDGFGSVAWASMPTLRDFVTYCSPARIGLAKATPEIIRILEKVQTSLNGWISGRIGNAISNPSTIPLDNSLFAVALTQLNNVDDSKILAMAINLLILRRQLSYPKSVTVFDESPILFEFDAIAAQIGRMTANGAKAGSRVLILAQEARSIARSKAGSKVLANLGITLIGRVEKAGVEAFVELFSIPIEIVRICASKSFERVKGRFCSQFLLLDGDVRIFCGYHPSFLELAAVANNPYESVIRQKFIKSESSSSRALALTARELIRLSKQ